MKKLFVLLSLMFICSMLFGQNTCSRYGFEEIPTQSSYTGFKFDKSPTSDFIYIACRETLNEVTFVKRNIDNIEWSKTYVGQTNMLVGDVYYSDNYVYLFIIDYLEEYLYKYDTLGNLLYQTILNLTYPVPVTVPPELNNVVGDDVYLYGLDHGRIVKIRKSDGNVLSQIDLEGISPNVIDIYDSLIYVGGTSTGILYADMFTTIYDSIPSDLARINIYDTDANLQNFMYGGGSEYDYINSIDVDSNGIFIGGTCSYDGNFSSNIISTTLTDYNQIPYIVNYDLNGNIKWLCNANCRGGINGLQIKNDIIYFSGAEFSVNWWDNNYFSFSDGGYNSDNFDSYFVGNMDLNGNNTNFEYLPYDGISNSGNGDISEFDNLIGSFDQLIVDTSIYVFFYNNLMKLDTIYYQLPMNISTNDVTCSSLCNGLAQLIQTNNEYIVNWSNGETNDETYDLCTGLYTVSVLDEYGCVNVDSFNILEPDTLTIIDIIINATSPFASDGSIEVNINGGTQPYCYEWSNSCTMSINNNLTCGFYELTVTDNNNCAEYKSFYVDFNTNVINKKNFDMFKVFPNPFENIIHLGNKMTNETMIIDLYGNEIIRTNDEVIDLNTVPNGVYILYNGINVIKMFKLK